VATSVSVQERLTEILVQVVDCAPGDVIPDANLGKDLGVDSLSIVEVCEKLGQDFGVYISDETINSMVTVQDAVDAIVHHDHTTAGPRNPAQNAAMLAASGPSTAEDSSLFGHLTDAELNEKKRHAWRLVGGMAGAGLAIGLVLGIGGAALINASGIKNIEPPPAADTTAAATEETASPTPTPTPSPTPTVIPTTAEPELKADAVAVSPGQRIVLSGTFAELGKGALLQVQIKDPDTDWDDFPVTTRTGDDGEFRTIVRTTRQGERKFRMLHKESDKTTPTVMVAVG